MWLSNSCSMWRMTTRGQEPCGQYSGHLMMNELHSRYIPHSRFSSFTGAHPVIWHCHYSRCGGGGGEGGGDTPCRPSCYKPPVDKTLYQDSLPTFSACCVTTPTLEPHEMASHWFLTSLTALLLTTCSGDSWRDNDIISTCVVSPVTVHTIYLMFISPSLLNGTGK